MKHSFTAIDFETAHGKRWSICQVGLVRVENGIVKETYNKLVYPPNNYYFYRNSQIHGITAEQTMNALGFAVVWHEIKHFIHNQNVVAHNISFDMSCLQQALDFYGINHPECHQQCTYKIYGKGLASLCEEHSIQLNHHDALSDALACAELYKLHLKIK